MLTGGRSSNLGLSPFPEFTENKYPDIFADSTRIRMAINALQTKMDQLTGALPLASAYQGMVGANKTVQLGNLTRFYANASQNINAGQMVNFHNVAGVLNARKAGASSLTTMCRAFCNTTVLAGAYGEFILMGVLPGLSSLVPGALIYLSDTAGLISTTPGTNSQVLGYALSATELYFNPQII